MDKKTVADDALISTDIDSLIKYLSAKKRIDVGTLARELGMKPDIVRKWVAILEDEGYVRVDYHLLNEYVSWTGEDRTSVEQEIQEALPKKEEKKEKPDFSQNEYVPKEPVQQKPEEKKEEKENLFKQAEFKPEPEAFKADERVERIMERLGEKSDKPEKKSKPAEEATRNIISSFKEERSDKDVEREEEILKETMAEARKGREPAPSAKVSVSSAKSRAQETAEREERAQKEKEGEEIASLKRSLSEYMDEIKVQKDEIEKLKAAREKLLAEAYLPLESRFKSAFDSITERLLEKEGKIIEMKERVMELPGKIGEIGKVEAALRRIREEGRRSLAANRDEMARLARGLKDEDSRLKEEISSIEKDAKARKAEVLDITHTLTELEAREGGIKKSLEELNRQLAEINEGVAASYGTLSQLTQTRGELSRRLENIKITLDSRANEASASYAKLQDVKKAESIIGEYLDDYQKKIAGIEDYARQSEKELGKLKEFAEVKYMKGYLKELDSISSNYEQELEAVGAQEKSIDERLAEAKDSLNTLLKDSRNLVKSLEKKTSGKDFEKLASEVKARQEQMVATVKEKSMELDKAREGAEVLRAPPAERKAPKPSRAKKADKKKKRK